MRILQVASEAVGVCKTGGLADVVTALSAALVDAGDAVELLLPAYRGTLAALGATPLYELGDPLGLGQPARIWSAHQGDHTPALRLLQCDALFDRTGGPYVDEHGVDWPDNHLRFALLGRAAAQIALASPAMGRPFDVVHAHDWQAGMATAYLSWWGVGRPATVFTVHNLHFTGRFPREIMPEIGAPPSAWSFTDIEFYGQLSYLKAGLVHADRVTTVSPTYADEIRTPESGIGFDGLLRWRGDDVRGILNGIDAKRWDPGHDTALGVPYDADHPVGKQAARVALRRELGIDVPASAPVFGMVTRLTWQKGVDFVTAGIEPLLATGGALVVLGSGEPELEQSLAALAAAHPGRVVLCRGYDEALSHRIFAGADFLAVPSRFEPCGLTQMYAMRYGTPPIVRRTGGLADTVVDDDGSTGTGFVFEAPTAEACTAAMLRAAQTWQAPDRYAALQRRAMAQHNDWRRSAATYRSLYAEAAAARSPRR